MAKKSTKSAAKTKQANQITKMIWWSIVLGGIASIIFGLIAVFWPGLTLTVVITIFAAFVVVLGIIWLYESFTHTKDHPLWWLSAVFGALALVAGIYLFVNPETTIKLFAALLVIYVFVQSLLDLVVASYSKRDEKWLWVITGILGIIFGLVILFHPIMATVAMVWVLGLYALVHGLMAIIYATMCRKK